FGPAAARRRTSVVVDPKGEAAEAHVVVNVVRCGNPYSLSLVDRHARAVDSRAKSCAPYLLGPSPQVSVIARNEASSFFDVEKCRGAGRKPLLPRCGDDRLRIGGSLCRRVGAGLEFARIATIG